MFFSVLHLGFESIFPQNIWHKKNIPFSFKQSLISVFFAQSISGSSVRKPSQSAQPSTFNVTSWKRSQVTTKIFGSFHGFSGLPTRKMSGYQKAPRPGSSDLPTFLENENIKKFLCFIFWSMKGCEGVASSGLATNLWIVCHFDWNLFFTSRYRVNFFSIICQKKWKVVALFWSAFALHFFIGT